MDNKTPISVLKLGVKAHRALHRLHIKSIGEFIDLDMKDVLRLDGVGKKTVVCLGVWQKKVASILGSGVVDEAVSDADWKFYQECLSEVSQNRLTSLGICSLEKFFALSKYTFLGRQDVGAIYWEEVDYLQEVLSGGFEYSYDIGCEPNEEERSEKHGLEHEWRLAYASFSVRTKNGLDRLSVTSPKPFLKLTKDVFLGQRGVGKKCWKEIEGVQKKLFPLLSSGEVSLWEPDPYLLSDYPLYSGLDLNVTSLPDEFYPDAPVTSFVTNVRAKKALANLGVKTLGELLLVRSNVFFGLKNCGKNTVRELRKNVEEFLEYRRNPETNISMGESISDLIKQMCLEVGMSVRDADISSCRICHGRTLESVAHDYGCTRERIRQVVAKSTDLVETCFKTRIALDYVGEAMADVVNSNRGIIEMHALGTLLAEKLNWNTPVDEGGVKELIRNFPSMKARFAFEGDVVFRPHQCRDCDEITQLFKRLVRDSEDKPFTLNAEALEELQEICRKRTFFGCEFADLPFSSGYVDELCERSGYRKDGDTVWSDEAHALARGGLMRKAEALLQMYGGACSITELWSSIEALSDTTILKLRQVLSNSNQCFRWGKDEFIHKDFIKVRDDILSIIGNEINQRLKENSITSVIGIFKEYQFTFSDAGVPNEYALASVVANLFSDTCYVDKFRYIHSERPSDGRSSITYYVQQWVLDQDGAVRSDEIKNQLVNGFGMREATVPSCFSRLDEVIPLGEDKFIHVDNLGLNKSDLQSCADLIELTLQSHKQIGVHRLFKKKEIVCFELGIESPNMLHALIQHFFSDQYECRRFPHISRQGRSAMSLNETIERYLIERNGVVSVDDCSDHFESVGYNAAQMKARLPQTANVFVYYPRCLIHSSVLGWSENKSREIFKVLEASYEQSLRAGGFVGDLQDVFDLMEDDLPELENGYGWTADLLASIAGKIDGVQILGNAKRAFTIKGSKGELAKLGDLVSSVVKNVFNGGCSRDQLSEWMREHGVVRKKLSLSMFQPKDGLIMSEYECYLESGEVVNG
ncbi:hypothetical protein PDESU_05662 [Pontiella desulfatans]|uniref:DNA-directed RNA polymerase subunit alpha n=1 Tax=Pontiella desulfatans TaxID=2750659 RepID=A0A6C2UBS1_PONDE|nr:hypothetical protein [Pontiella desulfatans]VGO17067.1 hypothetical protein PDESU_05662 [Pontiella desulfatans]